jgi:GNAT superfamily N-acetyltransferase
MGMESPCQKREIRPLAEADIEAYLDIYLNSYPAYKTLDAECRQFYREKHLLELREDRQVKTVGLFEDGVLIATMKLILFSMNYFGKMQPACGLMALEVHPLHKKQGAALEMVRYFEDYAREHGALLTLLLGLLVMVAFTMLVYITTFYTLSPEGVRIFCVSAVEFFAGAVIPLPFFPEKVQYVLELLPFAAMQNVPLRVYSGSMTGQEMLRAVCLQVFWLAVLTGVGWNLCRRAERRVTVQGG